MVKINFNLEELKGKSNKEIASALKKELKLQLKGIKFSVTSSIYSIDCSCSPEEFENNKEVIKEVAGMFSKYTVDTIYINNGIAYYHNTQEYQEQQKKEYEENQKQLEIKRQERENLYNSNVTVSEIKNANLTLFLSCYKSMILLQFSTLKPVDMTRFEKLNFSYFEVLRRYFIKELKYFYKIY